RGAAEDGLPRAAEDRREADDGAEEQVGEAGADREAERRADADEAQGLPERARLIVPRRDREPDRERPEEDRRRLVPDDAPVRDEVGRERGEGAGENPGAPAEEPPPDREDEDARARREPDEEQARRGEAVLAERADPRDVLRHRRVLQVPPPGVLGEV